MENVTVTLSVMTFPPVNSISRISHLTGKASYNVKTKCFLAWARSDCFFYLKDRNGYPWTLSTFYGTGDTIVDWNGLTKKHWLTLMMHLSLGMVQDLRRCNEGSGSSILVSGNGSYVCRIKYLVDLKGLVKGQ